MALLSLTRAAPGIATNATDLIVDIGSGSVAVAILALSAHPNTPSKILVAKRVATTKTEEEPVEATNFKKVVALIQPTIAEVVGIYREQSPRAKLLKATVVIHAPWITVATQQIAEDFETPQIVTKETVDEIAKKAILSSQNPSEGSVFEQAVVRTELNGYPTANPLGRTAKRIHVVTLVGSAQKEMVSAIQEAVQAVLPGATVTLRTSAHVVMAALNGLARRNPHYCAVDVTSESTGFTIVINGGIRCFTSVPIGWRTLIRELAKRYSTSPEEALSRLRMAIEESCTGSDCTRVLSSLSDAAPAYIKLFAERLAALSETERLPATLIVSAPPDIAPWFVELFSKLDFAPFTGTGNPFTVQYMHERHSADSVIFAPGVTPDSGIALSATFVHMRNAHI